MKEKIDDESGVVMIEATYCIIACIIVLMFFMSFGFYLYQNSTMGIVANEIAAVIIRGIKRVYPPVISAIKKIAVIGACITPAIRPAIPTNAKLASGKT